MNPQVSLRLDSPLNGKGYGDAILEIPSDPENRELLITTLSKIAPEAHLRQVLNSQQGKRTVSLLKMLPKPIAQLTGTVCTTMPWQKIFGENRVSGPNCFGAVLFWHGLRQTPRYAGKLNMEFRMNANFIELPAGSQLEFGDVLVERYKSVGMPILPSIKHAMIYLGDNVVWHKPSRASYDAWQFGQLNIDKYSAGEWRDGLTAYRPAIEIKADDSLYPELVKQRSINQILLNMLIRVIQVAHHP